MHRKLFLTWLGTLLLVTTFGQIKKQFTVEDAPDCSSIKLSLKANSGNCFIKPGLDSHLLNVFSNLSENNYSHTFKKEIKAGLCDVMLKLEESGAEGIGKNISTRFFGGESENANDKIWKMYLTESKPYDLQLEYGVGNAHVDLSGLSVKKLKINTASADVVVGYFSALENQLEMDTFSVKVDVGSINVKNINLSKPRNVVADVGFGSISLDFTTPPLLTSRVRGSVGAGNLTIILPAQETPVLVRIKDSWLCSVKLPSTLKKISDNTFASSSYNKNAKNVLIFDLDVSMGNIVFKSTSASASR